RAYEIWVAHDCVHGQADQHWLAAEGSLSGIDRRARPRTRPAKEATVACTLEDRQNPRGGRLTPHITPEMSAPVRRRSARSAVATAGACRRRRGEGRRRARAGVPT